MAHSKTSKHAVRWPIDPTPGKKPSEPEKERAAGRVMHDERGNAVYNRRKGDSTSTMLKRLEVPGLSVEGQEASAPASTAAPNAKGSAAPRTDVGSGYNPYDQGKVVKKPTTPKAPVGKLKR
jgi:hypothetical protein